MKDKEIIIASDCEKETIEIGFPMEFENEDGTIDNVLLLRPNEIKALEYKLQELERYKNIIDELEKYLKEEYEYYDKQINAGYGYAMGEINRIRNKLKELKGSDS